MKEDLDYQNKYSENLDVHNVYIEDYIPESMIKIFPYRAIFGNKNKSFLRENTIVLARIDQQVDDFKHLQVDENNNKYLLIFAAIDNRTRLTVSTGSSSLQQSLRKIKSFTAITNDYFDTFDDKPDFFTIGEPFNQEKYDKGEQFVYFSQKITPTIYSEVEHLIEEDVKYNIEVSERISELELIDVSSIEEQLTNFKIKFTLNLNMLKNPMITYFNEDFNPALPEYDPTLPESQDNVKTNIRNKTSSGIGIKVQGQSLISAVKAKGILRINDYLGEKISDSYDDIDFISANSLMPIKANPVSVNDKVNMFFPWFDYDSILPFFVAEQFLTPQTLHDIKIGENTENSLVTKNVSYDSSVKSWVAGTSRFKEHLTVGHVLEFNLGPESANENIFDLRITFPTSIGFNAPIVGWYGRGVNLSFSITGQLFDNQEVEIQGQSSTGNNADNLRIQPRAKFLYTKANNTLKMTMVKNLPLYYVYNPNDEIKIEFVPLNDKQSFFDKNIEDLKLIEDMIIISQGFKDNWMYAAREADGKIKNDFRVGHKGIKIISLIDKAPIDIIDGMFSDHIAKFPSFRNNPLRYQLVKSIINSLSNYINSNLCTNKGFNEVNSIILPWFLELSPNNKTGVDNSINYSSTVQKVETSEIGVATPVDTHLLPGSTYSPDGKTWLTKSSINFILKTMYFIKNNELKFQFNSKNEIEFPRNINLSSLDVFQLDRKIILPELPEQLSPVDYPSIPGDITGSATDLSYIFYLPINDKYTLKSLFLDNKNFKNVIEQGKTFTVFPPSGTDGIWLEEDFVRNHVNLLYGANANIISPIVINRIFNHHENVRIRFDPVNIRTQINLNDWATEVRQRTGPYISYNELVNLIAGHRNYDVRTIKINNWPTTDRDAKMTFMNFKSSDVTLIFDVSHIEFGPIQISNSGTNDIVLTKFENDFGKRQIYFDKPKWQRFISNYGLKTNQEYNIYLIEEEGYEIDFIDEIMLYSCWGNTLTIFANGTPEFKFNLNSKDESIALQRIIIF